MRQLYVGHLFTGLAAWQGPTFPEDDPWVEPVVERERSKGKPRKLEREWEFEEAELKPNPTMYRRVLADLGVKVTDAWALGDSLHKDVRPAIEIGAVGVWARYGRNVDPKNFETVLTITPWSQERIAATYDDEVIGARHIVDSFAALKDFIPPHQISLFAESNGSDQDSAPSE